MVYMSQRSDLLKDVLSMHVQVCSHKILLICCYSVGYKRSAKALLVFISGKESNVL